MDTWFWLGLKVLPSKFVQTIRLKLESQPLHEVDANVTDINIFFIVGQAGGYGSETKVMGGFGTNL